MRKATQVIGFLVLFLFIVYLLIPPPSFPAPPQGAVQSQEPADTSETNIRRAYFTNLPRAEVIAHYQNQFQHPSVFNLIPSYRLNYPPEEARTLVHDPTLSTYLEEIVYPFRESLFINGYEPGPEDDKIAFQGTPYFSKITVRYYQSNPFIRLIIFAASLGLGWWIWKEYRFNLKELFTKKTN